MERLLTARQLEAILSVKAKTILAWARDGYLPSICLKNGDRKSVIRFSEKEIAKWIQKRKANQVV